jgi:hypothetical protein
VLLQADIVILNGREREQIWSASQGALFFVPGFVHTLRGGDVAALVFLAQSATLRR